MLPPAKRRMIHDAPFWGVNMPAELFGLLCWLIAGFLDASSDRKSLKRTCKDALDGFRSNATRLTFDGIKCNSLLDTPRFYGARPFPRVRHIRFNLRSQWRCGNPFPKWTRNMFPAVSTMCIHTGGPDCMVQDADVGGMYKYPLDIVAFKGSADDLEAIVKGFEWIDERVASAPIERWDRLRRVTITRLGTFYRPALGPHAKKVLQHHRLERLSLYDPFKHFDDIMVHPPKQVVVDSTALAPVVGHPRFSEIETVALARFYDSKEESNAMRRGYEEFYDEAKLTPKLDAMSVARTTGPLPCFDTRNCSSQLSVASRVARVARAGGRHTVRAMLFPLLEPDALRVDTDFLVQALRGICVDGAGVYRVISVLRELANLDCEAYPEDRLTLIARRVFTSAQASECPLDAVRHEEHGVDIEFGLWREYFLATRFYITRVADVIRCGMPATHWSFAMHHARVTLAENFLRGDETSAVPSGLLYLYRSVYAGDISDKAAEDALTVRRNYITNVRESLERARQAASCLVEYNMMRICEERLKTAAAQCTGPLGQTLLGTGEIVLR